MAGMNAKEAKMLASTIKKFLGKERERLINKVYVEKCHALN
jgi:hypothetical protein